MGVSPDGKKVYLANVETDNVTVIDTATNTVIGFIPVGVAPVAFGVFIQPPPRFAGTPGQANCYGQSASRLSSSSSGGSIPLP